MRRDEHFSLFWQNTVQKSEEWGIAELVLPRRRKVPCRFEIRCSAGATPHTPEVRYRVIYFQKIDTLIVCVKDRFEQQGYKIYKQLEQVLMTNDKEALKNYSNFMLMT